MSCRCTLLALNVYVELIECLSMNNRGTLEVVFDVKLKWNTCGWWGECCITVATSVKLPCAMHRELIQCDKRVQRAFRSPPFSGLWMLCHNYLRVQTVKKKHVSVKGHYVSFRTLVATLEFQNFSGSAVNSRLFLCFTSTFKLWLSWWIIVSTALLIKAFTHDICGPLKL